MKPKYQRRHYIAFVDLMNAQYKAVRVNHAADSTAASTVRDIAWAQGNVYAQDNARFDKTRYLSALHLDW